MPAMGWIKFQFVLLLVTNADAQSLTLKAVPITVNTGLTDSLDINCSVAAGTDPNMASLVSITLSFSKNTTSPLYENLATVNSFGGVVNSSTPNNANISGLVDNTGLSFLCLFLYRPDGSRAGNYKCMAQGLGQNGLPVMATITTNVKEGVADASVLTDVIIGLKEIIAQMSSELSVLRQQFGTLANTLWQRLEARRKSLFEESPQFRGSRYYLSKEDPTVIAALAQASCEEFRGNLAEIGDYDEFEFIKEFIQNYTGFVSVIIGGSQYGEPDNWVYPHNNKSLEYFNWADGYPSLDMESSCLNMLVYLDWNMTNSLCMVDSKDWPMRYICEIVLEI